MANIKKTNHICFSENGLEKLKEILKSYPTSQASLLPLLHLAQKEIGYIDDEVSAYIARKLNLPPCKVKGSASFYTFFPSPQMGKYVIRVCQTLSCSLLGAEHLIDYLSRKLGIEPGQTTTDNKFSLLKSECLGSCGKAPVMMINDKYYENLNQEKIDKILNRLK